MFYKMTYKTQKGSGTRKLTQLEQRRRSTKARMLLAKEKKYIRSFAYEINSQLKNVKETKISNNFPRHINDLFDDEAKCLQKLLKSINNYKNNLDERLFGRDYNWNKPESVKDVIKMERKKIDDDRIDCERIGAKKEEAIDALPDIQSPISVNAAQPSLASTLQHSLSNRSTPSTIRSARSSRSSRSARSSRSSRSARGTKRGRRSRRSRRR